MPTFAGLDVSQAKTTVCIVDERGLVTWRGFCARPRPGPSPRRWRHGPLRRAGRARERPADTVADARAARPRAASGVLGRASRSGRLVDVVEATGNATAVAEVIRPHVGRVAIANPRQVRLIAEARIKTDVIDATVLARLYASGFLPEVWVPDQGTRALRRQVRAAIRSSVKRVRLKTIIQSTWCRHAHTLICSAPKDGLGCWDNRYHPMSRMRSPVICASTTV